MRVAVIGAGMTGLVAAYRFSVAGHECDVYERWPGLGGQVATMEVPGGDPIERYYHHLFTSDRHIVNLYAALGMRDAVDWLPSSVAVFAQGRSHPFTTPLDLLRFSPLSFASRIRMGIAVLAIQRRAKDVSAFEGITAQEWICRSMGSDAWRAIWGPLMRGKFGDRADEISAAWLWSKLTLRRQVRGERSRGETLGYPRGGWQPLLDRLRDEIERRGGRVLIDRAAARLARLDGRLTVSPAARGSFRRGHDPSAFDVAGDPVAYDRVVATVPSDVFISLLSPELADELSPGYLERLDATEYQAALCLLLEIEGVMTNAYWTNVADPRLAFVGLIEQAHLTGAERYGGRRFLYVANYVSRDDPLLELDVDPLIDRYEPGLRLVNPGFSKAWVRECWRFHEPAAQPIVTVGYQDRIPPMQTGSEGLVLANTTQIYPEDRGTNYSVRLGDEAASVVVGQ